MMKWIIGLLLLANLALLGWMRWGSALTADADAGLAQALNPDKVRLLELLPASAGVAASVPASATGLSLTLSALPAASAAAASAPLPGPAPVPAASREVPKETSCAEWGEFAGSDLEYVQRELATLKLGERLSQRSVEHTRGYWVYIPPMKKHADVTRKVAQLKERGVKDYFVVQEKGKWLNAISLGVFRSKEAAQKYLATLRTKDVRSARVGERQSKLKYTVFSMQGLDAATLEKLKAFQKAIPDSELKISSCAN